MKLKTKAIAAFTMLALAVGSVSAQEVRTLTINKDRAQKYMGTKVYQLKHVKAGDITPFLLGAVKRYNVNSDVQRLGYQHGKKEFVVVSTGIKMLPFVDEMVQKLDRPCNSTDQMGSIIDGDGIYRFVYCPKYRADNGMLNIMNNGGIGSGDGIAYLDTATNMFYWKDSKSDGSSVLNWLKILDRPLPQVRLCMNVYEVSENNFTELGVDYVSWKNGPGADLLGAGWEYTNFKSITDFSEVQNKLNLLAKGADMGASGLGGFMVAPQFDATFLRMLAQKGKAKIATSGTLTVLNDFTSADPGADNFAGAKYKIRFTPNYQSISKNEERNISVGGQDLDYYFYLRNPIISFGDKADVKTAGQAAVFMAGWQLLINSKVEQSNDGTNVINQQTFRSYLTLATGTEKLIGTFTKEHEVKQNNGIPFLCDIPVLKYLAGATANSKTHTRVFVTIKVEPVTPETGNLTEWAGKLMSAVELTVDKEEKELAE
jgi:type II secretory pathway component GspD/PulD (secretin)